MAIGVDQFQILSPDQANPFGYGMQQGSNIASQMMQNAIRGIQARYMPQQMQQDILSKQLANQLSQAQLPYAGPQAAAQLAVTQAQPGLMGSESAANYAQASRAPSENALAQAQAAQANLLTRNPLLMAGDTGQAIWAAMNMGGGQNPNSNQTPYASPNPNVQTSQQPDPLTQGINNLLTGSRTPQHNDISPTENANNLAQSIVQRKLFPLQFQQQQAQIPAWNEGLDQASKDASNAQNALKNLELMNSNYKNAPFLQTGFIGGRLPHWSDAAQLMDQASTGLQLNQDALANFAKSTNLDLKLIGQSKPTRELNQQAFNTEYPLLKIGFQRQQEHQPFMQAAQAISQQYPQLGLTKQLADTLYQTYNQQYPVFDDKGQAIPQNINNWRRYLTMDAINAAKAGNLDQLKPQMQNQNQGQTTSPSQPTSQSKSNSNLSLNQIVRFIGSDGKPYKVTLDKFNQIVKADPNVRKVG